MSQFVRACYMSIKCRLYYKKKVGNDTLLAVIIQYKFWFNIFCYDHHQCFTSYSVFKQES